MRKFALILLTSMVCVLSMAQSDEIVFTPQWTAQAQFAGYYAALEKGFYKEAGLKVTIKHPSPSNSSVNMLKEGKANFITIYLVAALKSVAEGVPMIHLLQTSQNNAQMIISHKPVKDVHDLRDMRIGRWKMGYMEFGQVVENLYNLNIKWIPFGIHAPINASILPVDEIVENIGFSTIGSFQIFLISCHAIGGRECPKDAGIEDGSLLRSWHQLVMTIDLAIVTPILMVCHMVDPIVQDVMVQDIPHFLF